MARILRFLRQLFRRRVRGNRLFVVTANGQIFLVRARTSEEAWEHLCRSCGWDLKRGRGVQEVPFVGPVAVVVKLVPRVWREEYA